MITIEKLNIYRRFGGDCDSFVRLGRSFEQQLFNDNDWGIITDCDQNIELIKKGLTSVEFRNKSIQYMLKNFDSNAFAEITKPISTIILEIKNAENNSTNA